MLPTSLNSPHTFRTENWPIKAPIPAPNVTQKWNSRFSLFFKTSQREETRISPASAERLTMVDSLATETREIVGIAFYWPKQDLIYRCTWFNRRRIISALGRSVHKPKKADTVASSYSLTTIINWHQLSQELPQNLNVESISHKILTPTPLYGGFKIDIVVNWLSVDMFFYYKFRNRNQSKEYIGTIE